jgi:hypothetical protein
MPIGADLGRGGNWQIENCLGVHAAPRGGARRLALQASPLHTNTALYPVVRGLELRAGFRIDDSGTKKWDKLTAAIPEQTPWRNAALRFLGQLMSLEPPSENPDQGTPSVAEQREAALDLLADVAKSETDLAPLVIVVEDAHWIDATTIELIERMLDRLRRRPAMALITYRPEFEPPWGRTRTSRRFRSTAWDGGTPRPFARLIREGAFCRLSLPSRFWPRATVFLSLSRN